MEQLLELVKLILNKYKDVINIIICRDTITLEYLFFRNNEQDVYKTIEVKTFGNKFSITIIPERLTKLVTLNELEDIFEILHVQSTTRKEFTKEEIQEIKKKYIAGTKIRLIKMYDLNAPITGTEGTVLDIDSAGHILVNWNNSSSLSLILGIDKFEILENK